MTHATFGKPATPVGLGVDGVKFAGWARWVRCVRRPSRARRLATAALGSQFLHGSAALEWRRNARWRRSKNVVPGDDRDPAGSLEGRLGVCALIELRDELDTMLHRIRAERHIRPPVIKCPRCGYVGEAAEPDVTVRAMILSVGRFGMAPPEEVKALEKRWTAYRKQSALDLYGKPAEQVATGDPACAHSNVPR